MAKKLLLVDNEDLSATIAEIEKKARTKNISISCFPLYIGLPDGNEVINESGAIDINLVKEKLANDYGTTKFDFVACDFKLNDLSIDGVELIRQFNSIRNTQKSDKILYSSELSEIVQEYLDTYKKDGNFDPAWQNFKTLINLDILDFARRENMEDVILNLISKTSEKEDDFITEELLSNPELFFKPLIEVYDGLTFGQIVERINNNDSQSLKFKKKLIQLAISHFAQLENE